MVLHSAIQATGTWRRARRLSPHSIDERPRRRFINEQTEKLDDYLDKLDLELLRGASPDHSERVDRWLTELALRVGTSGRQLIGLAISFVALAEKTLGELGRPSVEHALDKIKRETKSRTGGPVNTLNLTLDNGETVRLRPFYEKVLHVARNELRRYDYPNSAPHATQAWASNKDLLEAVFELSPTERRAFAEGAWDLLTALPPQRPRNSADALPRPFETVLKLFPGTQKGEPPGAILQGLAFAYYRADSPTVTIETGKAKAGSRRTGRIGDVDGWDGDALAISVEVKDKALKEDDIPEIGNFISNVAPWPDAKAIVFARSATEGMIEHLAENDVRFFDREAMLRTVEYWDLGKQALAIRELLHYLVHIEQSSGLIERFRDFCDDQAISV